MNLITDEVNVRNEGAYEVWTVPAGVEGRAIIEDGDVIENKLIDHTSPNSAFSFNGTGLSNFTVRNIGFRGVAQIPGDMPPGSCGSCFGNSWKFHFLVGTNRGGRGVVENVWMNNMDRGGQRNNRFGGVFVANAHSGELFFRNNYIQGYGHNAIYGAAPGQNNGGNGRVVIEDSFHRDCGVGLFRLGSPGSLVRNSVGIMNDTECRRGRYKNALGKSANASGILAQNGFETVARNISLFINSDNADGSGHCNPDHSPGNVVFNTNHLRAANSGPPTVLNVHNAHIAPDHKPDAEISSGPTGRVNIHSQDRNPTVEVIGGGGVPTNPVMAARGVRELPYDKAPEFGEQPPADGGGDGGGVGGGELDPETANVVVIWVGSGPNWPNRPVDYEMVVSGLAEKHDVPHNDRISAGPNDRIIDNGDGTFTLDGTVGNSHGDAYLVDGQVLSNSANGRTEIRVNGDTITGDDMPYPPTDDGGGGGQPSGGDGQARKVAVAVALAAGVYGLRRSNNKE